MVLVPVAGDKGLATSAGGGAMLFTGDAHHSTRAPDDEEHQLDDGCQQHMGDTPLEVHDSHVEVFCCSNI